MSKRSIYSYLFGFLFLVSSYGFWLQVHNVYSEPYFWANLDHTWIWKVIPLGVSLTFLVIAASLLVIFKMSRFFSAVVYIVGALIQLVIAGPDLLMIASSVIFIFSFLNYEQACSSIFHSFIKIDFWATYSRTVPALITTLILGISIGSFQFSSAQADEFTFTIPDAMVDQVVKLVLNGNNTPVTQTTPQQTTQQTAPIVSDELVESALQEQFRTNNITDPQQQEALRVEVRRQLEAQFGSSSPSATTQQRTPGTGLMNLESYQNQVRKLAKTEFERQAAILIDQYRPYLPYISAFATYFILSIINLPVMMLSIALVVGIMTILKALKVISVVKVKMDVERLAM